MIPLCHNLRHHANKVLKGVATDGKGRMVSRVQAPPSAQRQRRDLTLCLTGSDVDDRNPKARNVSAKDLYGKVFVDRG